MIHTVKGFDVVNEAGVDFFFFLKFPCFFYDPVDAGKLMSGSSAFSKSSLYIGNFSVYLLLKPSLKDFNHDLASMWNECNCVVIWTFFGIDFLWDWNENWPFPFLCRHSLALLATAPDLRRWGSSSWLLPLGHGVLPASAPDLRCGVAPLCHACVHCGFRKDRGIRDQIANICWIMEKAREFQKNIYFWFINYAKAFDCVDPKKLWKIL